MRPIRFGAQIDNRVAGGGGLAAAMPANADSVTIGTGDSGARVGVHEHAREQVTVGVGQRARHCKVVIVKHEGMTKKIKRCD
jgi:hypothetical protein